MPKVAACSLSDGLQALFEGKWPKALPCLSESVGLLWALVVIVLFVIAWVVRKQVTFRWQQWREQLSNERQELDPALLVKLKRAAASRRLEGALEAVDRSLSNWYGLRIWGLASFRAAMVVALVYPVLLLLVAWLLGSDGRLGGAVLLQSSTPAAERWLFVASLLLFFGILTVFSSGRWQACVHSVIGVDTGLPRRVALAVALYAVPVVTAAIVGAIVVVAAINAEVAGAAGGPIAVGVIAGVAVAGALAVTPSITRAVGSAGVGVVAVTAAVAVPIAIAIAGAIIGRGFPPEDRTLDLVQVSVLGGVFAIAGVVLVANLMARLETHASVATEWRRAVGIRTGWILIFGTVLVAGASMPAWLGGRLDIPSSLLRSTRPPFVIVFFFALLPAWNALCDYVSVAVTRTLLRSYLRSVSQGGQPTAWRWWLWLSVDLLVAFALTLTLLVGLFAFAAQMRRWGWGIDAATMLKDYERSPWWSSNSVWLVSMAFTNLLPTLAHVTAVAVAKTTQRWSRGARALPGWIGRLEEGKRINTVDAERLLWFLFASRPAWAAFFAILLCCVAYLLSAWLLSLWVPWLAHLAMGGVVA